jgi:hypothetical protein
MFLSQSQPAPSAPQNLPIGFFNSVSVSELTPQIELKSSYGITLMRNAIASGNGGYVAHSGASFGGEFELGTTNDGASNVVFQSVQRGRYQPGYSAECGVGLRLNVTGFTGSNTLRFGYFDTGNGFFYQFSSGNIFCGTRRAGVDTLVPRSGWLFGASLNNPPAWTPTQGSIYQINFGWYGYSPIEYQILTYDTGNNQISTPIHRTRISGSTSVNSPNLPIRVELNNNGSTEPMRVYVAGRQFSIQGQYKPVYRISSQLVETKILTTSWQPIISFRNKNQFRSAEVKPTSYSIINGNNTIALEFRINSTLTTPSWYNLSGTNTEETALESDINSTGAQGGLKVFESLYAPNTNQNRVLEAEELDGVLLPEGQPITVFGKSLTATSTVTLLTRFTEEW